MVENIKTIKSIEKIIHERTRLLILSYLASEKSEVAFNELKDNLELSAGNLSVQLKTLEEFALIQIKKQFIDNKPLTTVIISQKGLEALYEYLETMETIIKKVKKIWKNNKIPKNI